MTAETFHTTRRKRCCSVSRISWRRSAAVCSYTARNSSAWVSVHPTPRRAITEHGLRRMEDWLARCQAKTADFPAQTPDPFFNVNTPEDLAAATQVPEKQPARKGEAGKILIRAIFGKDAIAEDSVR